MVEKMKCLKSEMLCLVEEEINTLSDCLGFEMRDLHIILLMKANFAS